MRRNTILLSLYILLCAASALTFSACSSRPYQGAGQPLEMTLLHSNDIHTHIAGVDTYGAFCLDGEGCSGGVARLAALLEQKKSGRDNVLLLDAGDMLEGTLFYSVGGWRVMADLMSGLGYDAMTPGNHEFDSGCAEMAAFIGSLDFPALAANLDPQPGCPLYDLPRQGHILRQIRGEWVAVIGLTNPEAHELSSACEFTAFSDTTEAARREIALLEKQGVKHIILLTHLGLDEDRKLARALPGVDVIVGGHSHSFLGKDDSGVESPEGPYPIVERTPRGEPALVVSTGCDLKYLGELNLVFDADGVLQSWSGEPIPLDAAISPDPAVLAKVARYAEALDSFRSVVVGESALQYPDGKAACREADCLSGMLICEAMLEYGAPFGADAALINGGSVRAALPLGQITQGDILSIMPYGNSLLIREYSGLELLTILEHAVSGENGQGVRLLQSAGLRYWYDPAKAVGERISRVEVRDKDANYRALEPERLYRLVLLDFLVNGGDAFNMLAQGRLIIAPDPLDADIMADYVKRHSPLSLPEDGRINRR